MDDDAFKNDPAFKHLFSHSQMIELVIRRHFPEWDGTIDYSTLERRPTELIDDKKLRQRYPDAIWRARTTDGTTDLLLLLEFQGKPERHMVLRTTAYNALAVQELIKDDAELRRGERELAVASLVFHHGDRKWKAPTHLDDLFRGTALYTHRVADRLPPDAPPPELLDLPQLVLEIAGLKKPADVAMWVAELRRLVADCDNEGFNRFMARGVRAVLRSKKVDHYLLEEAETMGKVEKWYGSGFDEVRQEAREEGRVSLLRHQAARKFGLPTAEELARLLGRATDADRIDSAAVAIMDCDAADEFLARVRAG